MERSPLLRRTLLDLFEVGAIKFGSFRLKLHDTNPEAPLSPVYVDLRVIRSYPYVLRNVVALLGRCICSLNPEFIADVPTAATPIAGALAASFDLPMISPRMEQKSHGTGTKIEGTFQQGARVVLVDDLITKADSKISAIRSLEDAGLVVRDVVVLVDRGQGGAEELQRRGYTLHAATTLAQMLDLYVAEHLITLDQLQRVQQYMNS